MDEDKADFIIHEVRGKMVVSLSEEHKKEMASRNPKLCPHMNRTGQLYQTFKCVDCGGSFWQCPDCNRIFPNRLKSTSPHRRWHLNQQERGYWSS